MTPIEIMREAYDAEVVLWHCHTDYPKCTHWWMRRGGAAQYVELSATTSDDAQIEFEVLRKGAGHRAALRALAEMPLSETSGEAAFEVASMSDAWHIEDINQFSGAYRAALLAQAAEGEDLGRDGLPVSTEAKC